MAWTYHQRTGRLFHNDQHVAKGYSGHGAGKDNPALQHIHDVGPIPIGQYHISVPYNDLSTSNHHGKGPHVMRLTPVGHNALGRKLFRIHGDNKSLDGTASHGCIILPRNVRVRISNSGDRELRVVP